MTIFCARADTSDGNGSNLCSVDQSITAVIKSDGDGGRVCVDRKRDGIIDLGAIEIVVTGGIGKLGIGDGDNGIYGAAGIGSEGGGIGGS